MDKVSTEKISKQKKFTDEVFQHILKRSNLDSKLKSRVDSMSSEEKTSLVKNTLIDMNPEDFYDNKMKRNQQYIISEKRRLIVQSYIGITNTDDGTSLSQVALKFGISTTRVKQIKSIVARVISRKIIEKLLEENND